MKTLHALAVCALALPASAFAQNTVNQDIEDRPIELEEQEEKLETRVFFETEWHEFNNLDFRKLDESSDQAILDSDDRGGFAFTGVALEIGYQADKSTRLVVGTSYRGLWGNDQIGNSNRFGGFFYFTSLFVEYKPAKLNYQPTFRLGRQRFEIGGMGGARDYILSDTVDQLRIDFPLGNIGTLITIPVNVVGLSQDNDDVTFVNFIGQNTMQSFGFRGQRMTRRHGAVLVINPEKLKALDVRAYGFYTDIGSLGTGSDITYNGRLGNFSDNDWVSNFGLRASYTIADMITPFATFDASIGWDRKERVTNDVDTTGFAWSAGVTARKNKDGPKDWGIRAELSYFEAMGGTWQDNGQQYSHGYVGMKARHIGGLLTNRFLGWHPTGYVGMFGISDNPQDTARKAGSRVITLNGNVALPGPLSLSAGYWYIGDTAFTSLVPSTIDTITPPFGYSRAEYEAQARFGKTLGHEVNFGFGLQASKALGFYARSGVFLPGDFYGIEIARAAGSSLGSSDPQLFWDVSAGTSLRF